MSTSKTGLSAGSPRQKSQKEQSIDALREINELPKTKRLNVEISTELMQSFKSQAALDGMKINELTTKIIKEYLNKRRNE